MPAYDFKKEYKELYLPKTKPAIVDVPEMRFIMVDGRGDPNNSAAYKNAVEILYGLSYSIKMSKKTGAQPDGYFEYVSLPWRVCGGSPTARAWIWPAKANFAGRP